MSEISYVDGYIYKHQQPDGSSKNLLDETTSTYDFSGITKTSTKLSSDMNVKVKSYVWTEPALTRDYESNSVKKVVGGYIDNESESYFVILSPEGVQELATNYSLPMPINGDDFVNLMSSFESWGLNAAVDGYVNPVVASVKFDANESPYMLKLYRGNYNPSQEEINNSKLHWTEAD